jgi:hypothetical protein
MEDSVVRLAQAAPIRITGSDPFCISIEATGWSDKRELATFRLSISHNEIEALYRAMRKATK